MYICVGILNRLNLQPLACFKARGMTDTVTEHFGITRDASQRA